jgi:RHS repeat-associated protein
VVGLTTTLVLMPFLGCRIVPSDGEFINRQIVRTNCACSVDAVTTTFGGNTVTLMGNLSYRPFGGATGMDTGAGGAVDNRFDASGRLSVANPGAQTERTYGYDANGNIVSFQVKNEPWKNRTYTYDALNRLTVAQGKYNTETYAYDRVGNRGSRTVNSNVEFYSCLSGTNKIDQIIGYHPVSFTYDANGNTTGIGGKVLTYNQDNRLIRVEENGQTLGEYVYNGLGQRIKKTAGGSTTVFHYDFDGNIIAESDPSGTFTKEYLYNKEARLAMVDVGTGEVYFFLNDHLGTPLVVTDGTGKSVWEALYKPFGEASVHPSSTIVNNFRFPGQYYDQETGLHYNYFRYYNPQTGRYITPDPLGLEGGINLFLYAGANPLRWIDLWGLDSLYYSGGYAHWLNDQGVITNVYRAMSGPYGEGSLPAGNYTGQNLRTRTKQGMVCSDGGWSLDLEPNFPTNRKDLRMHPDQDPAGTGGCIGIDCSVSQELYNKLNKYFKSGNSSITVRVRYEY